MARAIARDVLHRGVCIDTVWYDERDSDDDVRRSLIDHDGYPSDIDVIRYYSSDTLAGMPTLSQSHADNLKVDTGKVRVWRCRIDGSVGIEHSVDGRWLLVKEYADN